MLAQNPSLRQGGCHALEDALALSICLEKHRDPPVAFTRFVVARIPKTRFVVTNSWRLGRAAHYRSRLARAFRDLILARLPRSLQRAQVSRIVDVSYLDKL